MTSGYNAMLRKLYIENAGGYFFGYVGVNGIGIQSSTLIYKLETFYLPGTSGTKEKQL